ncbi:hypothetical protein AB0C47_32365 [Micromonospora taraxaci]|uniref:hypothetical protein n=1 Tax=Micromonospora taraxaci TaxID=1316803 RepID=UPI0033C63714
MTIEKELERVDFLRIGEPRQRVGRAGRVHRAPHGARELGKFSGSGSPAIVAAWFAWWYLRPANRFSWSAMLSTYQANRIEVRTDAVGPH